MGFFTLCSFVFCCFSEWWSKYYNTSNNHNNSETFDADCVCSKDCSMVKNKTICSVYHELTDDSPSKRDNGFCHVTRCTKSLEIKC